MKYLLALAALLLVTLTASAQTFQCSNTLVPGAACAPGTAGCACSEVMQAPAPPVVMQAPAPPVVVQQAPPACPFGTYYNGGVCVQPAPAYVNPYPVNPYPYGYQHPYGGDYAAGMAAWSLLHPGQVYQHH